MTNLVLRVGLFFFLAALQSVIGQLVPDSPGTQPLLVTVAVITIGVREGARAGFIWSVIGGILLELTSASYPGSSLFPLALVATILGLMWQTRLIQRRFILLEATAAGCLLYLMMRGLLLSLGGHGFVWIVALYQTMLPTLLVSLVVAPLVDLLCRRLRTADRGKSDLGW